jgi:hypothetical protein
MLTAANQSLRSSVPLRCCKGDSYKRMPEIITLAGARVTTLFEEKDGTTTMRVTVLAASKKIRDAVLANELNTVRPRPMTDWRLLLEE